ncbi:DUF3168 domain-containing protein [Phenylobacterium sp.]|uniref:tail completion protein gp17 n=1 Tax=Phenylobacterium sp. TaxID=1871053 RepID=UPI00301CE897
MEALLKAAFLADADVVEMVVDRAHWDQLPDRKRVPAVIFHEIGGGGFRHTMRGRVPTTEYVVQVDCWAASKAAALDLRRRALAALDRLKGPALEAFPERSHASWTPTPGAGVDRATSLFRASIDVRCWHHETA